MVFRNAVLAALLAGLGLSTLSFGADDQMKAVLARVQALEEKNKQLEDKLKAAQAVAPASANVDKAVAASAATMSSVITTADPKCRPLTIGGYLDATYEYNFNRPVNQTNNQRIFDNDSNGFNMHLAELTFSRLPTEGGQAGFRIDTAFGTDPRVFASQDTQGTGRGNQFEVVDLKQAYMEYIVGCGCNGGVTIDMGKFVTWAGAEVIEAADNMNASRSFLFGDAIPFTHTGLRATYTPFKDKWTIGAGVVNAWDFVQNPMNEPTAIFYSDYKPLKWLEWQFDGSIGNQLFIDERQRFADATSAATFANPGAPELDPTDPNTPGAKSTVTGKKFDPSNGNSPRVLLDTVITLGNFENCGELSKFTFVLNGDYAAESNAPNELPGVTTVHRSRQWYGGAAYVKYQFLKKWYVAGRYEAFNDPQGARTGFAQVLQSATITADWMLSDPLHIRFEYRHDMSNVNAFGTQRDINSVDFATQAHPFDRKYQDTIMMQWLYKF